MSSPQRSDIQVLRGFAVLLVLFYHADLIALPQGFLGVDIFFVISGYLITGMVAKDFSQGRFSFAGFYFRRAKRLLPAAYVTFLITSILAPFLLGAQELADYHKQLLGALTFTGNVVLFQQSGYFEGAAELKLLLHVWSLSLEEQYYLILPALIALTPRRYWLPGGTALLLLSLGLCVILAQAKPIATFYLLPTRAWELGIGSLAALIQQHSSWRESRLYAIFVERAFWPSLFTVAAIPFMVATGSHPGIDAFIACTGTATIILRRHTLFERLTPLKWVGDWSYSLYLVHWPIFAAIKNAAVGPVPPLYQVASLFISFILGWALYRWVETPFRRLEIAPSRRSVASIAAASGLVLATSPAIASLQSSPADYTQIRRPNDGFAKACFFETDFRVLPECRSRERPKLLVWGDSHAMHLVTGLANMTKGGVMQATRGMCGPILGMAPLSDKYYQREWAQDCIRFNDSVLKYVRESAHIETIVLSSAYSQYLDADNKDHRWRLLVRGPQGFTEQPAGMATVMEGIRQTLTQLRSLGKRVVFIASPPSSGFNIGTCVERRAKGMLVLASPTQDCSVPRTDQRRYQAQAIGLWAQIQREGLAEVISFDDRLCTQESCTPLLDGTLLYVDSNHFTHEGFALLAKRMELGTLVERLAR